MKENGSRLLDNGILNEMLLEKNIEMIKYYSSEEKRLLSKINNKIGEISKNYHSTNSALLMNSNSNLKSNINYIYNKRIKYTTVLNEVILRYQESSNATVEIFNNMQ